MLFRRCTCSAGSFPSSSENEKFSLSCSPFAIVRGEEVATRLDPNNTDSGRWEGILANDGLSNDGVLATT